MALDPEQMAKVLAERQAIFNIALAGTDTAPAPSLNPLLEEALASQPKPSEPAVTPSSTPGKVNVGLGGALGGATVPFNVSGFTTEKPDDKEPASGKGYDGTFYDMLVNNEAYRLKNREAFERNEKENRARTAIAAVSDALSSLGNLVGTTAGAANQTQTYQTPFVTEQVQADRKEARKLAQALQENDITLRLTKAKLDASQDAYDKQLEKEQVKLANNLALIAARGEEARKTEGVKQEGRLEIEKLKQDGRVDLKQMDIEYKQDRDAMLEALRQQGINISRGRLDEMIRHNQAIEVIRENGGGGVGGYKTIITRDKFGREISRERIPAGGSGSGSGSSSGGGKKGGFSTGGKKGGFS